MPRKRTEAKIIDDFDPFIKKVGERLRKLRIAKGYTSYEQFAYEHNIGRAQYGKYERGSEDMRISSLYKIVVAMGITMDEFFGEGF